MPILAETGRLALMSALVIALAYPALRLWTPGFWWPGWTGSGRAVLIAIDVAALSIGVVLAALLVGRGFSDLGWDSLRYLVVPILLLALLTFALDPARFTRINRWPIVSAVVTAATLSVLMALLVASVVAVFAHGAFVVGVLVMLFAYRLLGQAGTWRWAAWDEQARAQFRRELAPGSPESPRRLGTAFDTLVFVLLGSSAVAAVVAFGLGNPLGDELRIGLFTAAGVLLLSACLLSIGQDIANGARLTGTPIQPLQSAS